MPTHSTLMIEERKRTQILLSLPEFKSKIKKNRARWGIPDGGFLLSSDAQDWFAKNSTWIKWTDDKARKEYLPDLMALYPEVMNCSPDKIQEHYYYLSPYLLWHESANRISDHYHLGQRWREALQSYILFYKTKQLPPPKGIMWVITGDDEHPKSLSLIIDEHVTLKEYRDAWKVVKEYRDRMRVKMGTKIQPLKKHAICIRALDLSGDGLKADDIADKLNKEFKLNIKNMISAEHVRILIYRAYKLFE